MKKGEIYEEYRAMMASGCNFTKKKNVPSRDIPGSKGAYRCIVQTSLSTGYRRAGEHLPL